jgi:hypothetical protein
VCAEKEKDVFNNVLVVLNYTETSLLVNGRVHVDTASETSYYFGIYVYATVDIGFYQKQTSLSA